MPPKLLNLPEEILDACIYEVFPRLAKGEDDLRMSVEDASFSSFPVDILRARLVCRLFNRLALPLFWRRVSILLDYFPRVDDGLTLDYRRCLGKWMYLSDHPEVAAHIRIFSFECRDAEDYGIQALTALLPALRRMDSLRVVRLENIKTDPEALHEIFSKPKLHTFIGTCQAFPVPPQLQHSLVNIRHLCVSDFSGLEHLLELTPNIEYSALLEPFNPTKGLGDSHIPWGILREIEIHENKWWTGILDNFSSWKQRHGNTQLPLSEICIDTFQISRADMERILTTFSGQPLSKLMVLEVENVDVPLLQEILTTFPHLEDFGLFTSIECKPWGVALPSITAQIASFPKLRILRWNFVDEIVEDETEGGLMLRLQAIAETLVKSSKTLNCVQFFDNTQSFTYRIEGDKQGRHEAYWVEEEQDILETLYTSAWHISNFDHI